MANATTPVIQINEGNVGIGTITPASKLQVEDDSPTLILNHNGQASASQCEISARISGYATPPIGTINWNTGYAGSNSTWSYYNQSTSTNNFLKLDQTDGFIVSLSGSEKMRVNQAGNVGIGVTAPTTGFKLHVQGNIRTSRIGSLDGSINIKNNITGQLYAGYSFVGAGDLVVGGSGTSSQMPAVITLINLDSSISANQDLGVIQFGGKDDNTNGYCNAQIIGTAKQAAGSGSSGGGHLRFLTATASTADTPNERMRITDVGNVGINTTSPRTKLHVTGLTGDDDPALGSSTAPFFVSNTANSYGLNIGVNNVGASWLQSQSNTSSTAYNLLLNPLGGNVGIGTTSPAQKLHVEGTIAANTGGFEIRTGTYGNLGIKSYYSILYTTTSVRVGGVGGISYKSISASAFYVNSDYRLKSNLVPLEDAVSRVKQLPVYRFNWNDKENESKVDGFLAHEVSSVVPEAVTGEKDAVREDGTLEYQQIDQSKIVPLLTAALKEAIEKIEQLENRIQTLENN